MKQEYLLAFARMSGRIPQAPPYRWGYLFFIPGSKYNFTTAIYDIPKKLWNIIVFLAVSPRRGQDFPPAGRNEEVYFCQREMAVC